MNAVVSARARLARIACGIATIVVGALSVISALTPDVPWRRHLLVAVEPGSVMRLGHVLALVGGVALAYLGLGVAAGKRRAASIGTGALVALGVLHLVKGLDYEEAGVTLGLAGLLWASRGACHRGASAAGALLAAAVALGAAAAAYTLDVATFLPSDDLGSALSDATEGLGQGAWWLGSGRPLAVVLDLLLLVALTAGAVCLRALLRPARAADGHGPDEHARAAAIVARYGRDSLDPFALREEKAFFFTRGGVIAYRTLRETAVVSGDPIGPPGEARAMLAEFLAFAARRGWTAVLTAVSPDVAAECQALGLRAICIGQEASVDPARFTLEGRAIRKVRQSVVRAERRGWTVEVVEGVDPGSALATEIAAVESRWRSRADALRGFAMSLGRLWGAPEDAHAVYALGRAPDGELRAFVRFARCAELLSLDVMRRGGDEPNGLNEALIARTLEWARDHGVAEVSLNFAGFAHVMASRATLRGRRRVLAWLLERVHGRFQLERLVTFNEKFRPQWRPRYLVYPARAHLPLAALRVLQAEAYIRAPRARPHPGRWIPDAGHGSLPARGALRSR